VPCVTLLQHRSLQCLPQSPSHPALYASTVPSSFLHFSSSTQIFPGYLTSGARRCHPQKFVVQRPESRSQMGFWVKGHPFICVQLLVSELVQDPFKELLVPGWPFL
jgi:hypothetical protein